MGDVPAHSPALLVKRMLARAARDQLRHNDRLCVRARELEAAIPLYPAKMAAAAFMRIYARACKAWRDHTGEQVL